MNKKPPFSINGDQPGSALKDFATLLDFIQEGQYKVSKKLLYYPPKGLLDLNQRMTKPLQHDFKRPTQKSFFHIDQLYQAARQLGFISYKNKGKNKVASLNKDMIKQWKQLNDTEQYFTLLETCLADNVSYTSIMGTVLYMDKTYLRKGKIQIDKKTHKNLRDMRLFPGLACMELFGLYKIESDTPETSNGWKIKSIEKTIQGKFLLPHFESLDKSLAFVYTVLGLEQPSSEKNTFYNIFSPFFPEYKNIFTPPSIEPTGECDFIFKVSLGKCWRRIALNHKNTLDDLAVAILHYFDFENDHLHEFSFMDSTGQRQSYPHYAAVEGRNCASNEITLANAGLIEGMEMTFLFDFGDDWRFHLLLEDIHSPSTIDDGYFECYLSVGDAPKQYPDYEDEY